MSLGWKETWPQLLPQEHTEFQRHETWLEFSGMSEGMTERRGGLRAMVEGREDGQGR